MYAVAIEMPSGMQSRPHEFKEAADACKLQASFVRQMRAWKDFEAWVLVFEGTKVIDREHVKT